MLSLVCHRACPLDRFVACSLLCHVACLLHGVAELVYTPAGETLQCLTTALQGMDHKMAIIFNKCDQFTKIHDFARAYGSLCWNLSKVIPRKDLPPIYTMCVPVDGLRKGLAEDALEDLHSTRLEVINKVCVPVRVSATFLAVPRPCTLNEHVLCDLHSTRV